MASDRVVSVRAFACACSLSCLYSAGLLCLLGLLGALEAGRAHAQDVQRFHPALSDSGFIGIESTRTPETLRGSVHVASDLALSAIELRLPKGQNGRVTPVQERLMLHIGGELGLGGLASVGVRVPVIAYQHGPFATNDPQVFMLTDPQLWGRYRLIGASADDENEPQDGPGLAILGGVTLPLGKREKVVADDVTLPAAVAGRPFASDGYPRVELTLLGDFHLLGAGAAAYVGYRHHFWHQDSISASATGAHEE